MISLNINNHDLIRLNNGKKDLAEFVCNKCNNKFWLAVNIFFVLNKSEKYWEKSELSCNELIIKGIIE